MSIDTVFTGRIIHVNLENVTLPNGVDCTLEIVHHPGGAAAVALDDAGQVCMLRQFRHAVGEWLWELPAGKIDNKEPHLETAQRELREEAGLIAGNWQSLGAVISSPGVFTEAVALYLASGLTQTATERESEEVLEVHWFSFSAACAMARDGTINDAKTVIGLLRADAHVAQMGS
jgi:8-oxo-dGTP pyrophosphatase MutT (NUDIX family)